MNISSAKYIKSFPSTENTDIGIVLEGLENETMFIPISEENKYYAEIMRQVEAGELTIAPADEEE